MSDIILSMYQRRIILMLQKKPNMTVREIASKLYGKQIGSDDWQYISVTRMLNTLIDKGLLSRTTAEVRYKISTEGKKKLPVRIDANEN
jgi:predicted transcriptional regulator